MTEELKVGDVRVDNFNRIFSIIYIHKHVALVESEDGFISAWSLEGICENSKPQIKKPFKSEVIRYLDQVGHGCSSMYLNGVRFDTWSDTKSDICKIKVKITVEEIIE